jgi:hypothetical protein
VQGSVGPVVVVVMQPGREWSCPGLVDGSGLGGSVGGLVAPFVVGRAALAEGGVAAVGVVEALQVVEDGHPAWVRVVNRVRSRSSHSRVAKKLSVTALS